MKIIQGKDFRNDIEGLRAIAVLSVIIFHLGYLSNGYLGVDIFFVISGYLITRIIYQESLDNKFSLVNFYIRRIRRIIPLVSFVVIISLIVGVIVMLPDDLENLAQSIVSTNFFSNNILQVLTTKNYWDVVNEYKPLMHTWSLAVEEQYYMLYPLIFLVLKEKRTKWILPLLIIATIVSLILFFSNFPEYYKFYLLPFRFFELSIGGIAAIIMQKKLLKHNYSIVLLLVLFVILFMDFKFLSNNVLLVLTTLITTILLISENSANQLSSIILENKIMVGIGKISFSLYMWHQIVLAFSRYFIISDLTIYSTVILLIVIFILSIISYFTVEQIFRNKKIINTSLLLWSMGIITLISTILAFMIYIKGGILKDIPELDIKKIEARKNIHAKYNAKIYDYDKDFNNNKKIKILVIGDSFARDWVNILLESEFKNSINISYIYDIKTHKNLKERVKKANLIFVSEAEKSIINNYNLNSKKTWCIGTKNFGKSNGIIWNYTGKNYYKQRTVMMDGFLRKNALLKKEWGNRYIDLISMTIDKKKTVPIFTENHKFISQDCRHLTKAGAKFFATLTKDILQPILDRFQKGR